MLWLMKTCISICLEYERFQRLGVKRPHRRKGEKGKKTHRYTGMIATVKVMMYEPKLAALLTRHRSVPLAKKVSLGLIKRPVDQNVSQEHEPVLVVWKLFSNV